MLYTRVNKEKKEVHVIYEGVVENLFQSYKLFAVLDNLYFLKLFLEGYTLCFVTVFDFSEVSYIEQLSSLRKYFNLKEIRIYSSVLNQNEISYKPDWLHFIPSNGFFWHLNSLFGWDTLITKKRERDYDRVKKIVGYWNRKPRLGRLYLQGKVNFDPSIYSFKINNFPNKKDINSLLTYFNGTEESYDTILKGAEKINTSNVPESKLPTVSNSEEKSLVVFSNSGLYRDIFVNLIAETLCDFGISSNTIQSRGIFLTEKIAKPMLRFRPFLVYSNPGYYKKLKSEGFKTFDKYWDESFDEELDFSKRISKFTSTLEYIESISIQEAKHLLNDMDSILTHNYLLMMDKMNSIPDYNSIT